jgi:hypothetical protein
MREKGKEGVQDWSPETEGIKKRKIHGAFHDLGSSYSHSMGFHVINRYYVLLSQR